MYFIRRGLWPVLDNSTREGALKGPTRIGKDFYLVSAGPILSRLSERVGTDIVLYKLSMLKAIIEDYSDLGASGETIVGDLKNSELPVFFPLRAGASPGRDDSARMAAVRQAIGLAQQNKTGVLLPDQSPDPSLVIAYGPIEGL